MYVQCSVCIYTVYFFTVLYSLSLQLLQITACNDRNYPPSPPIIITTCHPTHSPSQSPLAPLTIPTHPQHHSPSPLTLTTLHPHSPSPLTLSTIPTHHSHSPSAPLTITTTPRTHHLPLCERFSSCTQDN